MKRQAVRLRPGPQSVSESERSEDELTAVNAENEVFARHRENKDWQENEVFSATEKTRTGRKTKFLRATEKNDLRFRKYDLRID